MSDLEHRYQRAKRVQRNGTIVDAICAVIVGTVAGVTLTRGPAWLVVAMCAVFSFVVLALSFYQSLKTWRRLK